MEREMSGKDPELSRLGEVLSGARKAYTEAKKSTDAAKTALNEAGGAIQLCNNKIAELKAAVDAAYDSMRTKRASGDRNAADSERARAQMLQEELTAEYENKKAGFAGLDAARAAFNEALGRQKELRETVQSAWDAFNERLEFLKTENAKAQEDWKEKPCRMCGKSIRYNVNWKHIPSLCKECYEKDKENWEDRECVRCGSRFRINKTWEHIPTICGNCRKEVKQEKAAKAAEDANARAQEAQAEAEAVQAEAAGSAEEILAVAEAEISDI